MSPGPINPTPTRRGTRRFWAWWLVLLIVAVVAFIWLWRDGREVPAETPPPASETVY